MHSLFSIASSRIMRLDAADVDAHAASRPSPPGYGLPVPRRRTSGAGGHGQRWKVLELADLVRR